MSSGTKIVWILFVLLTIKASIQIYRIWHPPHAGSVHFYNPAHK